MPGKASQNSNFGTLFLYGKSRACFQGKFFLPSKLSKLVNKAWTLINPMGIDMTGEAQPENIFSIEEA